MNPESLLGIVAEVIKDRPCSQIGPWQICYLDKRIRCVSVHCTRRPEIIFLVITEAEARVGLEKAQWTKLKTSIMLFWSQKKR